MKINIFGFIIDSSNIWLFIIIGVSLITFLSTKKHRPKIIGIIIGLLVFYITIKGIKIVMSMDR